MPVKAEERLANPRGFRDARCYPRYRTRLSLEVSSGFADPIQLTTAMVSMREIELVADQTAMRKLLGKKLNPDFPRLGFQMVLPEPTESKITGELRIINCRRVAQSSFILVGTYLNLTNSDRTLLGQFLEECTPAP